MNPPDGIGLGAGAWRNAVKTLEAMGEDPDHYRVPLRLYAESIDRAQRIRLAAMTGMRQGELLALRWLDLDWVAQKVRVRRGYVRGEFKSPKSRRGSRAVPMADELAGELERLFQRSVFQADARY